MMLSSAAASHRNIFILRQAETMSDRSSSLEINLPGHMNSIGNVVTDTHKSLFRQQGSSSVFKADRLTEMVFLDLLASMRTAGWTIFASNAYFDTSGKSCIKTFYFSEDIYMSKLNSIEQIIKQLKASGIATSGIANATDEEAAALTTSTAHEELIAVANDPTANLPFMAKLKIEEETNKQRKEDEERNMNEALLLQRREAELQSQMHENSRTSHYSKLGSAFFSDTKGSVKPKVSARGSNKS